MFVTNFYQFPEVILNPPALANMIMWYRGDSLVGSPGAGATGWNDKVGSTHFGVSETTSQRPVITSNVINGKTVARFTQSSASTYQYFDRDTVPVQAQPITVVFIAKANSVINTSAFGFLNTGSGNGGNDEFAFSLSSDDYYPTMEAGDWTTGPNLVYSVSHNDNTWHVWQLDYNNTSSNMYRDGSLVATGGSLSSKGLEALYTVIGNNSYTIDWLGWEGDIAELIFYNRLLTSGERSELASYVSGYYGL